ncbi:TPA: divalent-cation tolerance protein CutA [Candidatus Woesearchaeota archaeon]|nr:divalent-cation tolerance protein CutA [Candidatus Woesearchaeota archaeon]
MILIYTTVSTKEQARKMVLHLLEKNVIACATMTPTTSMYNWKGNLKEEDEIMVVCKTLMGEEAKKELETIHPYETPCILTQEIGSNTSFTTWVMNSLDQTL